ncbi:hypothetical protein [Kitasatospora sp. KL5]|uniref:hypothetical protein n=1 Tax=Kitasatospora sp. KL5 TaxID=3425125 RepID=UPI003D6E24D7
MGPTVAVYATDILWRRNRYSGSELTDETPAGPFRYTAGVNRAGATALVAGTTAAVLCLATVPRTGPVAAALGGTDLSLSAGILVASAVYPAMMRPRRPAA